ncbi:MAG: hypothetical protein F6K00_09825 [Leptolyngbya sp. SIOISBB]|nr:hypothetical protein [Leptolyngbya sp. SIOISBB]
MALSARYFKTLLQRGAQVSLLGGAIITYAALGSAAVQAQTATAQASESPPEEVMFEQLLDLPSNYSLDRDFSYEDDVAADWPVVSQESVSLYRPTLPSFWWSRDQLPTLWRSVDGTVVRVEGYRLIRDWTAFYSQTAETAIVDVQVDPQYWNRFNYFQKFAVLRQLGATGMNYGYHVRIYNSIDLAGLHTCDFTSIATVAAAPNSEVPLPELRDVNCSAAIGPFVEFVPPDFGEDLFAPP